MKAISQFGGSGPKLDELCARSSDFFLVNIGGWISLGEREMDDRLFVDTSIFDRFRLLLPSLDGCWPGSRVPTEFVRRNGLSEGSFEGFGVP